MYVIDSIIIEPPPEIINEVKEDIFWGGGIVMEVAPQYKRGLKAMKKYFCNNLQYPEVAKMEGIYGNVIISFIVSSGEKIENSKRLGIWL